MSNQNFSCCFLFSDFVWFTKCWFEYAITDIPFILSHLRLDKMVAILADNNFKCIFLNQNDRMLIQISLKFVPRSPIDNKLTLVQVMAWRRRGDKPLPKPMLIRFTDAYAALGGDELIASYCNTIITVVAWAPWCLRSLRTWLFAQLKQGCCHWTRYWLVACSIPSHSLNQCWVIVSWILGNKTQLNLCKYIYDI